LLVGLVFVALLIALPYEIGHPLAVLVIVGVPTAIYYVSSRWRRHRDQKAWRATVFEPGSYSVVLSGFRDAKAPKRIAPFLCDVPDFRNQSEEQVRELLERAAHIAPQPVAEAWLRPTPFD
jgi:hypothetical protein